VDERRRCFVISPIAAEDSEMREHADDVFEYIIRPAMELCDIEVFRSDHLKEPGKVTDQMFREIMSDLCIAVLTGKNPNVFYELAIAQAAARPVIMLMEKGNELPFDIEHLRCVYYDLKIRPIEEGVYRDEIVEHVRSLEANDWYVPPPFGAVTPLRLRESDKGFEATTGSLDFFDAASAFSSVEDWSGSVRHTTDEFSLLDLVPFGWECSDHIRRLYLDKAAEGCRIRFLTSHPDNPALGAAYASGLSVMTFDEARAALDKTSAFFSALASDTEQIEFRQMREGLTYVQVTRLDHLVTVIPYLNSKHGEYLPLWRAPSGHALYTAMTREFDQIWDKTPAVPG
jgi:hypothetical protein